jgi:hypothetical protein
MTQFALSRSTCKADFSCIAHTNLRIFIVSVRERLHAMFSEYETRETVRRHFFGLY